MAEIPGSGPQFPNCQFMDAEGVPVPGGKVYTYVAGTVTPKDTYTDSDLSVANTNPIILDAAGRGVVYLQNNGGYKFNVVDADDVQVSGWPQDNIENVAEVILATLGNFQAEGGKDVTSGYQVLATDRLVTADSTGGANPCVINLPEAAEGTQILTIKNMGTVALEVTPDGSDTIDGLAAAFDVAAASSPTFPAITLVSDGVSAWYVVSSHGL